MPRTILMVLGSLLIAACGPISQPAPSSEPPTTGGPTVRILLVGDVMTGRGVSGLMESDPESVFAAVRHLLEDADVVAANLESPLTTKPHVSVNVNMLEADPATAQDLAAANFDVMSLPNNHSTDAGPDGLLDTVTALTAAGMAVVGAGANAAEAGAPTIVRDKGLTVGFLAYDATGVATTAGSGPGVATWEEDAAIEAVRTLRPQVDVLVVSIHGGTEYLPVTDPGMRAIAERLSAAGADVVWGHGAHVVQPVELLDRTVVATSLGNFLFDQGGPDRTRGAMLEVLAGRDGILAYRVGITEHPTRRVEFVEWLKPDGDAVWLNDSWWTLATAVTAEAVAAAELAEFRHGDLVAAVAGDVTGDGGPEIVASFRRPHRSTPFMELHPEIQWADAAGRSAHLGVYDPDGLREIWVAGSVLMPVADLAVCDGSVSTIHNQLDDPEVVAAGAWEWNGFGFDTAPDIPGQGTPACTDIDGDGSTEPVILGR